MADYLIHFNKNHSKANGQFVSGDGDGDGISNDHKNQKKELTPEERKARNRKRALIGIGAGVIGTAAAAAAVIVVEKNRKKKVKEPNVVSGKEFIKSWNQAVDEFNNEHKGVADMKKINKLTDLPEAMLSGTMRTRINARQKILTDSYFEKLKQDHDKFKSTDSQKKYWSEKLKESPELRDEFFKKKGWN